MRAATDGTSFGWNGFVRYDRWWSSRTSTCEFGERISRAWTQAYAAEVDVAVEDLVQVDPGNGFHYTFDLAGSLRGETLKRKPPVVGVWGLSIAGEDRDRSRMRGHPRPRDQRDDRGHLIAAGGGYDINLVAMDAALNRGVSVAGARFRSMEGSAAATPGTLYFVRLLYDDGTARPSAFEVGVQVVTLSSSRCSRTDVT